MLQRLNRKLDFIFYHEYEIRKFTSEQRSMNRVCHNFHDPTGESAVRNLMLLPYLISDGSMRLQAPELWLAVIECTWRQFAGTEVEIAAQCKYRSLQSMNETCALLQIPARSYIARINAFRSGARALCVDFRLVDSLGSPNQLRDMLGVSRKVLGKF